MAGELLTVMRGGNNDKYNKCHDVDGVAGGGDGSGGAGGAGCGEMILVMMTSMMLYFSIV